MDVLDSNYKEICIEAADTSPFTPSMAMDVGSTSNTLNVRPKVVMREEPLGMPDDNLATSQPEKKDIRLRDYSQEHMTEGINEESGIINSTEDSRHRTAGSEHAKHRR